MPISIVSLGSDRLVDRYVDRLTDIGFAVPALRLSQHPTFLCDERPLEVSSAPATQNSRSRLSQAPRTGSDYSR
ncbi:hypothetical protein [Sphingomonas sp. KC8]|uniref:hypothetical protein n=1 Tax=Sphingomonas sp. KC8 TaxID=1030157 RepID=UPI000314A87D|nr:hypothetical protein [Sphingomonas sp. KC8]